VKCTYFEIYNDQVYDLLDLNFEDEKIKSKPVSEDFLKSSFYVRGLHEEVIDSYSKFFSVLNQGEENRHYVATNLNHQSSRSHTIFQVIVQTMVKDVEND
jgi:hypothetical protein